MYLVFFVLFITHFLKTAAAQDYFVINQTYSLFNQYNKDYLYQKDIYQKAYTNYLDKKYIYTKYGTLVTEKEKVEATKQALVTRNNMLKSYLMALRVKLDFYVQSDRFPNTQKLKLEIIRWEEWLEEQNRIIVHYNNSQDISTWAEEFKKKYYINILQTIYTSLVQNEVNLKYQTLTEITALGDEITQIGKLPPESTQWFSDLPIKNNLVIESLDNSLSITESNQKTDTFNNFYPESKKELYKANNYLSLMLSNLQSIITKFINQ